jgi:hypothetical protein
MINDNPFSFPIKEISSSQIGITVMISFETKIVTPVPIPQCPVA